MMKVLTNVCVSWGCGMYDVNPQPDKAENAACPCLVPLTLLSLLQTELRNMRTFSCQQNIQIAQQFSLALNV